MSKNIEGIVSKIRSVRAQKRPDLEKKKERIDTLLAAVKATRCKASAVAAHYPDLATALQGVAFNDAEISLQRAAQACEAALLRLRRESINIGVAGKARQGKSQILQMLTGLGDKQIPTGNGGFCTASRSIVHNRDEQFATIHYLTEHELLAQKIYPSYAPKGSSDVALGLPERPSSVAAFISQELPTVPETEDEDALINWGKVCTLQADLRANPALVAKLGAAPECVALDTVRDFLVKDNGETNYQVVDHVEIATSFDTDLPKGMTVYDLPGLEDPSPGIRETMLKCVSEDADIVFLLRMPKNTGDDWDKADLRTMTDLKKIYPNGEVLPKDWIQLVLNLDKRPDSHNEKNVTRMAETAPRRFSPVICDCGSKDAVREMIDANIDSLVNQAGRIDDLRIRQADEAFSSAIDEAIALRNHLRSLTFDIINPDFDLDEHIEDFMSALRGPLREGKKNMDFFNVVKISLTNYFVQAKTKLNDYYQRYDEKDKFPEDFPIFSKHELFKLLQRRTGPVGALEDAVRTQRESILKLLRDQLSLCCGDLCNGYFEHVARLAFASNPALQNIVPEGIDSGPDKRHYIHQFLNAFRKTGTFPWLEKALESLLRFDLSFDNTILPWIYGIEHFADFDPDRKGEDGKGQEYKMVRANVSDKGSFQETADYIFEWMKQKTIMILEELTSPAERKQKLISGISSHVAHAMESNYDSFLYCFIWGKPVEKEWTRFADKNKTVFWRQEYEEAQANSQLKKDWDDALSNLAMQLADVH